MILRILGGLVLAILGYFASRNFWQAVKRDRFFRAILRNESFLREAIDPQVLSHPPPAMSILVEKHPGGYAVNVLALTHADRSSIRLIKIIHAFALVIFLVLSYFLGLVSLIATAVAALIAVGGPLSAPAMTNARRTIGELAAILYRWRHEDPHEYSNFIETATVLQPLDRAVAAILESDTA